MGIDEREVDEPSRRVTIRVSARHYEAIQQGGRASGVNFSALMEAVIQVMGDAWMVNGSKPPDQWEDLPEAWQDLGVTVGVEYLRAYWGYLLERARAIEEVRRRAGGRPKGKTRRAVEAALAEERDPERGSASIGSFLGTSFLGVLYAFGCLLTQALT